MVLVARPHRLALNGGKLLRGLPVQAAHPPLNASAAQVYGHEPRAGVGTFSEDAADLPLIPLVACREVDAAIVAALRVGRLAHGSILAR